MSSLAEWKTLIRQGDELGMQQRLDDAERCFRDALTVARSLPNSNAYTAVTLEHIGDFKRYFKQFDEAETYYRSCIEPWKKTLGEGHTDLAECHLTLSRMHLEKKDYNAALSEAETALNHCRQATTGFSSPVIKCIVQIASVRFHSSDHYESIKSELDRFESQIIDGNESEASGKLSIIANHYLETGRYADAARLYQSILKIDRKTLGDIHFIHAHNFNNLGYSYMKLERWDEAEDCFSQSINLFEQIDSSSQYMQRCIENYAQLLSLTGRRHEAEALKRKHPF